MCNMLSKMSEGVTWECTHRDKINFGECWIEIECRCMAEGNWHRKREKFPLLTWKKRGDWQQIWKLQICEKLFTEQIIFTIWTGLF